MYPCNNECSCSGCQSDAEFSLLTDEGEVRPYCEICASHAALHGEAEATISGQQVLSEKDEKRSPCKNGCGTDIIFDSNICSTSGKLIPLNAADKTPHKCPNASPVICKFCSAAEIYFELTPSGKSIPITKDGSFHECPNWPSRVTR